MRSVILPSKSISPPITTPPYTLVSEFSPNPNNNNNKPTISFDNQLNHLCRSGCLCEAIAALDSIPKSTTTKVTPSTFTFLIQSCIDSHSIHLGRKLHRRIDLLRDVDPFIETKLVGMYAKCGSLEDARKLFDEVSERNLFTWSAMIGAYCRERKWTEVVGLFYSMMVEDGIVPDDFLFPKILQACGNCGDVETGRIIHSIVVRCGIYTSSTRVQNSILALYAKCGRLDSARRFFENMEGKDRVSWNSVISGYCQRGEVGEARLLFEMMRKEGIEPGLVTWNILIASYNQLGSCDIAMEVMKEMEIFGIISDVFTWTSMISGFAQNNRNSRALELFREMLLERVEPNGITLTSAISACASLKDLKKAKELHSLVVKTGFDETVLVGNSLIDMYSKCGEFEAAREVFDTILEKDVYTWNSIIGGYCQSGYCGKAHDLFTKMQESGVLPNVITWNVMITGYIQNGDEDQATNLFQDMENYGIIKRNTASWNALIAGYLRNGQKNKALRVFRQMQSSGVRPNSVTILSILPACANLVAVKKVREIHCCVFRRNFESELSVANSLIDSYAKSGNIVHSRIIFDRMLTKDIITWNTLINSFVYHGCSYDALDIYDQMKKEGVKPNRGTFVSTISAYALAKMVDEGERAFSCMTKECNIVPYLDHCVAMVNLFGRSGRLQEAAKFIEDMDIEPDFSVWDALLTACRVHQNVRLAILAGECLHKLEPGNASIQRLLLQTYALCGICENSLEVKKTGKRNEPKESLGQSWIEVGNSVHNFVAGHHYHLDANFIYSWIKRVAGKVKGPDSCGRLCMEEEEKEEVGGIHSEKLALAFALIDSSQSPQTIRIVKNLRMCGDCHGKAKLISKAYGCDIYLSDSKCLHHFKDGHCSCGDYW